MCDPMSDQQVIRIYSGQQSGYARSLITRRSGEAGLSFVGAIFWLLILVFVVAFVVKVMPSYYDYWSLKNIVSQQERQSVPGESAAQIRRDLNARLDVAMIHIPQKGIQIEKAGAGPVLITISYDKIVPLVGNVSLLLHFDAAGH
uniref:Putative transmembrane protein n=1 Tax=mine drainage metagenome TaxID=410659 RepID=E6QAP0_9ZZZZ